ncbi:MAG: chromosomal replication initiator protein DnaA [Myxococcales bacterium]|nr:chromosomal replication initiator protein DnaA [Myxococcales bacterium]
MQTIWNGVIERIRRKVNRQCFNAWFRPIRCVHIDGNEIVLAVPDRFFLEWVRDNYLDVIVDELRAQTQHDFQVHFSIQTVDEQPVDDADELVADEQPADSSALPKGLNHKYTFDTFVVGASNQFAHAACQAVSENPAGNYNPLFVYGGVGLGKTHLLHAIGHRAFTNNPQMRIKYISTEAYVNELIACIRTDRMEDFRRQYRQQCDMLLVDDIQFLAGKDRTQDEFFHMFNALHGDSKQIVVTSDKFPQEIPELEERLRSRFNWGLIADIQPPDMETRVAILKGKAEQDHIDLPDEVAMYIANHIKSNVRELEGSLIRLEAYASIHARAINITIAKQVLRNILQDQTHTISGDQIQKIVANYFNVKVSELKSARRHKVVALPRQIAMYLCRKHTEYSFPEIGQRFGGRDHSTVISAVRKIDKMLEKDLKIRKALEDIEKSLLK